MLLSRLSLRLLACLLGAGLAAGCGKSAVAPATTGSFAIELDPVVGTSPLVLNSLPYPKADGQTFAVASFRLLLSGLTLLRADGSAYTVPNGYYLLDAADDKTFHFVIDHVPLGDYTGLRFVVGVDAAHNNATFESGGLSHRNGLYSEASQRYTFLQLTGSSAQAPGSHALSFAIGGPDALRTVTPDFKGLTVGVKAGHVPEIHLHAHVEGLFGSATPANNIDFATTYLVAGTDPKVQVVADNYAANTFTVEHVHPN